MKFKGLMCKVYFIKILKLTACKNNALKIKVYKAKKKKNKYNIKNPQSCDKKKACEISPQKSLF